MKDSNCLPVGSHNLQPSVERASKIIIVTANLPNVLINVGCGNSGNVFADYFVIVLGHCSTTIGGDASTLRLPPKTSG